MTCRQTKGTEAMAVTEEHHTELKSFNNEKN